LVQQVAAAVAVAGLLIQVVLVQPGKVLLAVHR
jgi:hypothetical protein